MNNDNYKAPATTVMDPPVPELPARPRNVNIALGLVGGGVLIQLFPVLRDLRLSDFFAASIWMWAAQVAGLVLYGVICHQIAHGRSWPRLLLLVITLLLFVQLCWGVGFVLRRMPEMWEMFLSADFVVTRVLPMVMSFIALHLLYFSSGDWFRRRE